MLDIVSRNYQEYTVLTSNLAALIHDYSADDWYTFGSTFLSPCKFIRLQQLSFLWKDFCCLWIYVLPVTWVNRDIILVTLTLLLENYCVSHAAKNRTLSWKSLEKSWTNILCFNDNGREQLFYSVQHKILWK